MRSSIFGTIAIAILAAGCSDPYEGRWEGAEDPAVDLDVRAASDGYTGDGHIYLCNDDQCFLCGFDFDARENNGRMEADGEFTGDCSDAGAFNDIECTVNEDRMDCDIGGGVEVEYERVD